MKPLLLSPLGVLIECLLSFIMDRTSKNRTLRVPYHLHIINNSSFYSSQSPVMNVVWHLEESWPSNLSIWLAVLYHNSHGSSLNKCRWIRLLHRFRNTSNQMLFSLFISLVCSSSSASLTFILPSSFFLLIVYPTTSRRNGDYGREPTSFFCRRHSIIFDWITHMLIFGERSEENKG